MNAFEIIGLACVDDTFREELFTETTRVMDGNPGLTWSERQGLIRVTTDQTNKEDLKAAMIQVGIILKICNNPPCPWPKAFAQNPMT